MPARDSNATSASDALSELVGCSQEMMKVRKRITQIAHAPTPVLILGETGTGKEVCARAIYQLSGCRHFVPVNCAAIAEGVMDSELFGHVRGAFTGADRDRTGLIAEANGGMLFLDELAEMSSAVQAKLLRTLESGEFRPVGAVKPQRSDFRIVAATSGNIEQCIASGKLRPDLLHRLGALRIVLPPLRSRVEDIPLLASEFLVRYRTRAGAGPTEIDLEALTILERHNWPGNLRELRNVIEAAAALAGDSSTIRSKDVLGVLEHLSPAPPETATGLTMAEVVRRAEDQALTEALRRSGQNRRKAASLLGISEATLYRLLAQRERHRGRATSERSLAIAEKSFSSDSLN